MIISFFASFLVNLLVNFNYVELDLNLQLLQPQKFLLYIYSTLFIFAIIILLTVIFNNITLAVFVTTIIGVAFGVINSLKLKVRGDPFFSQDFAFISVISDLLEMLDKKDIALIMIVGVLFSVLLIIMFRFMMIGNEKQFDYSKKSVIFRIVVSFAMFTFLLFGKNFNATDSYSGRIANKLGFINEGLTSSDVYAQNGFVLGFLSSFKGEIMKEPENYSKKTMEKLIGEYQEKADTINKERKYENFEDINIIYILSESLSNPNNVEKLELNNNPLEYIENIYDKAYVGKVIAPTYGGGTTNAEFEVLTSLSIQELNSNMSLPFQDFLSDYDLFPSIISEFKKGENNSAISFHSFTDEMYKRKEVYESLSFDYSYFRDDMTDPRGVENSMYISDESLYDEVYKLLENSKGSIFVNAVTMQNHYPYNDFYSENEYKVINGLGSEDSNLQIETFSKGISITDIATKEFINKISNLDKKTIVVFYGDHLPGIYNDYFEENDTLQLSETPYFVYSNFSKPTFSQDGVTSLSMMNNLVKDLAGVKITPYDAMILDYRSSVLAGRFDRYVDATGKKITKEEFDVEQMKLYNDFTLFQYDLLSGKQYYLGNENQ